MAFVDFLDNLLENGDLAVVQDRQSKIRNLLEYRFAEAPQVYFDVSTLLAQQVSPSMASQILSDHLSDYGVSMLGYQVNFDNRLGIVNIQLQNKNDLNLSLGEWYDE